MPAAHPDGSGGGTPPEAAASDPPLLPGPAAVRRERAGPDRLRRVARRQLVGLTVLFALTAWWGTLGYQGIRFRGTPPVLPAVEAEYHVDVNSTIRSMTYDVSGTVTEIVLGFDPTAGPDPQNPVPRPDPPVATIDVGARGDHEVEIVGVSGTPVDSATGSPAWRSEVRSTVRSVGPNWIYLVPTTEDPVSEIRLLLRSGTVTTTAGYRFLRTAAVTVTGRYGSVATADGTVTVDTGPYTVERFVAAGVSSPGESTGSRTQYVVRALPAKEREGLDPPAFLEVPAVSVDLVDVEQRRSLEPRLLMLGAVLGIAGGLLIEIVLTAAHLSVR